MTPEQQALLDEWKAIYNPAIEFVICKLGADREARNEAWHAVLALQSADRNAWRTIQAMDEQE